MDALRKEAKQNEKKSDASIRELNGKIEMLTTQSQVPTAHPAQPARQLI